MPVDISKWRLEPRDLKLKYNMDDFDFKSTQDLKPLKGIIGQERAAEALNFGLKMKAKGYNIFVAGISGTGRSSYTYSMVSKVAQTKKNNKDYVYVYNFKNPDEPKAISFQAGEAKHFQKDMDTVVDKLYEEIPKVFTSREYELRNNEIAQKYERMGQNLIEELNEFAKDRGFFFQQGNQGLLTIPLKEDGSLMSDEEYNGLSEDEFARLREKSQDLNKEVTEYMNRMRNLEQKLREKIIELDRKTGERVISFFFDDIVEKYSANEKVILHINDLKEDMVEHINKFKGQQKASANPFSIQKEDPKKFFERYKVNLFIDNSDRIGAPIVNETNPTYYNLTGMMEYKNEMGFLTTSFMDIKPGALHKANGGFLILNVKDLFSHQFAWEGLKRSLKTNKVTIETLNKQYGYIVTATLKPEPIDMDLKVILIGDYYTYSVLFSYDEDFRKLFRIMADFDVEMQRSSENVYKFARSIATQCEEKGLKHFSKEAVEKVVEYSSRLADSKDKLSSRYNQLVEILYEADALSDETSVFVTAQDVQRAINAKRYRNNKYEEKLNEMYEDGTLLIDIDGEKIGQINGLAVMGTGEYSFGKPARITASSYKGKAGIINVEREVRRSGSSHDKGVLILSGYIGEKYAKETTLSVTTSITFEQNYSGIDGDSASSTELYVILSSIAQIPIKQYIAVTGSISQKGEIQPIGGVNEKIEGFFDVCMLKG
ncbi:MAG: AAA family ATPase, partial [Acetoanaerobium sp.]|nr:AAA family ATPase [Acetoanaerobium sp.]